MKVEEMRLAAKKILADNDEIFVYCVDELDNWDGFADGFRAYDMSELEEFHCGMSLTEFLDSITEDFNIRDNYFYYSVSGLESCDYKEELYRDNTDELEVLDNLIYDYYNLNLEFIDYDFNELIGAIVENDTDNPTAAEIIAEQAQEVVETA